MDPMNLSPSEQIVFQLPPLALHLVSIVAAQAGQGMGNSITKPQYKVAQALATPGVPTSFQAFMMLKSLDFGLVSRGFSFLVTNEILNISRIS